MLQRGKWSQPGVPHKGWTCIRAYDNEEVSKICGMCETVSIRYIHVMTHPEYQGKLECGCTCAGNMEESYENARMRDKNIRVKLSNKKLTSEMATEIFHDWMSGKYDRAVEICPVDHGDYFGSIDPEDVVIAFLEDQNTRRFDKFEEDLIDSLEGEQYAEIQYEED